MRDWWADDKVVSTGDGQPSEKPSSLISGFDAALEDPDAFAEQALMAEQAEQTDALTPDTSYMSAKPTDMYPTAGPLAEPDRVTDMLPTADPLRADLDETDDARARRGFGRAAYMDDGQSIQLGESGMIVSAPDPAPAAPAPDSTAKTDDARAKRGFGRSAYMDDGSGPNIPEGSGIGPARFETDGPDVSVIEGIENAGKRGVIGVGQSVANAQAKSARSIMDEAESGMGTRGGAKKDVRYYEELNASLIASLPELEAVDPDEAAFLRDEIEYNKAKIKQLNLYMETDVARDYTRDRDAAADEAAISGAEALVRARELAIKRSQIPFSDKASRAAQRLADAPDTVEGTFAAFGESWVDTLAFFVEVGAESSPQLAASALTAVITKNPAAAVAMMGVGTASQEYGASVDEFLSEQGVDLSNADAAAAVLQDKELMAKAHRRGLTRAIVIAAFEAGGMGTTVALTNLTKPVRSSFSALGVGALAGGSGEAAARAASGQEWSSKEVILEAAVEAILGGGDVAVAIASKGERSAPATGRTTLPPPTPPSGREEVEQIISEGNDILDAIGFKNEPPTADAPPTVPGGDGVVAGNEAPPPLPVPDLTPDAAFGDDDFDLPEGAVPAEVLYPTDQGQTATPPQPTESEGAAAGAGTSAPEAPQIEILPQTGNQENGTRAGELTPAEMLAAAKKRAAENQKGTVEDDLIGPEVERSTVKRATVTSPTGHKVEVEYSIVEASDLIPSNTADGRINPDFPAELQPRDRTRPESQQQIDRIAAKPDASLVAEAPLTSDGAPLISRDGVVESGNGRVLGLRRAYSDRGTGNRYKADLQSMGYNIDGYQNPILVRVRTTPLTREQRVALTRDSNARSTMAMSATERATADAQALPTDVIGLYRGGDIDTAGNRDFVRAFIQQVAGESEGNALIDGEGRLSQEGIRRIEGALIAKAYGSPELVANLTEASDSKIKGIGNTLKEIAPRWAQMRRGVQVGRLPAEMDFTGPLVEAVSLVNQARREGRNLAEYVGQGDMFGEGLSEEGRAVLSLMFRDNDEWTKPVGQKPLVKAFNRILDEIEKLSPGSDLLGDSPDPAAVLALGKKETDNDEGQEGLFGTERTAGGGTDGNGAERQGTDAPAEGEATGAGAGADRESAESADGTETSGTETSGTDSEAADADAEDGSSGTGSSQASGDGGENGSGGGAQELTPAEMLAQARAKAKAKQEKLWGSAEVSTEQIDALLLIDDAENDHNHHFVAWTDEHFKNLNLTDEQVRRVAEAEQQFIGDSSEDAAAMLNANLVRQADALMQDLQAATNGDVVDLASARQVADSSRRFGSIQNDMDLQISQMSLMAEALSHGAREEAIVIAVYEGDNVVKGQITNKADVERARKGEGSGTETMFDDFATWALTENVVRTTARKFLNADQQQAANTSAQPNRTAGQAGSSAVRNTGSGIKNAAKGLNELFGGGDPNRLNSGLTFDRETYERAKPYFIQAIRDVGQAGQDIMEMVQAMVDGLIKENMTLETQEAMEPYQLEFIRELQAGFNPFEDEAVAASDEMEFLATGFQEAFEDGEAFGDIRQARKRASEILGREVAEADYKAIEEGIEVGVVMAARDIAANTNLTVEEKYSAMVDLYQRQPKLAERTGTSMRMQAYSTPAPLAYLASRLADLKPQQRVYEPSAGTGMLLMEVNPIKVTAVEMQPSRIDALNLTLGDQATIIEGDATEVDVGGYTAVLANPPFGKVKNGRVTFGRNKEFELPGMDTTATTTEVDHAIVAKALDNMAEGGDAVLIIGGQKGQDQDTRRAGYQSNKNRLFFKKLYDNYDVVEHFTVDGRMYERQGAGWPVDVIVIRGKAASAKPYPMAVAPELFNSWEALGERLDGTRDSLDTRERSGDRLDTAQDDTAQTEREPIPDGGGNEVDGDNQSGAPGGNGGAGGLVSGTPGTVTEGAAVPDSGIDGPGQRGVSEADGGSVGGLAGASGQTESGSRPGTNAGTTGGIRSGTGADNGTSGQIVPLDRQNTEVETSLQVQYAPHSNALFAVGTLVPRNMQTAMDRALANLSDQVGDIDNYVAEQLGYTRDELLGTTEKKGYFSAEQVDALALAISNVKKGKGFIIGDQTGVGKGRVVAAMLRYAEKQGHIPVFVTDNAGLFKDMVRDMRDIGMGHNVHERAFLTDTKIRGKDKLELSFDDGDVLQSMTKGKTDKAINVMIETGQMPEGKTMVWTSYHQLQQVRGGQDPRRKAALRAISNNAMFILDESHMAGGRTAERAEDHIQSRGDFVRELLVTSKGVVFSSATYAKNPEVMTLYAPTDLSLAVDNIEDLSEIMSRGGVPMQQITANMLVESGQFVRRERSFDGIDFNLTQMETNVSQSEAGSDLMHNMFRLDTDYMQDARENFMDALAEGGAGVVLDNAVGERAFNSADFASTMHNLVKQILLAIKVEPVIKSAIELHKRGEKPIITLANTNGEILKEFLADEGLQVGDTTTVPFSAVLDRYMERLRRVSYKDDNDKLQYVYMNDTQLARFGGQAALNQFNEVKTLIRQYTVGDGPLSGISASPIDALIDGLRDAGIKVEEVTGREIVVNKGTIERRVANVATKVRHMANFNVGRLDALILNRSGSTGFSLHATAKPDNDGKKRHMLIMQPEENINDFMQMLGRPNRTGQSRVPEFTIAVSSLAIEKRPAAVLMRKLASLSANTTASRDSAVDLDNVVDFLNPYGDEIVRDFLLSNPELSAELDISNHTAKSGGAVDGLAQKFTNKISLLPPSQVTEIYEQIESEYLEYIEILDAAGENALEAAVVDLDAKTVSRAEIVAGTDPNSPFGAAAYLEKVDVKKQGKPYTPEELESIKTSRLRTDEGQQLTPEQFVSDQVEVLTSSRDTAVAALSDRFPMLEAELAEANTEKQRTRATDKISRTRAKIGQLTQTVSEISSKLKTIKPGAIGMLTMRVSETNSITLPAYSFGADLSKLADNPAAASNIKITVALADAQRQITFSATKLLGDNPDISFALEPVSNHPAFLSAFKQSRSSTRETRHMVTGNLVAGFGYLEGSGKITMYTDDAGVQRQGILMPQSFDPVTELERQPVALTPAQVLTFISEGDLAERNVETTDGKMAISINSAGNYILRVERRVGRAYVQNQAVIDLIGEFRGRTEGRWSTATVSQYRSANLQRVLEIYADEIGIGYQTQFHRDEARLITGESVPEMNNVSDDDNARYGIADALDGPPAAEQAPWASQTTTMMGSNDAVTRAYREDFSARAKKVELKLNAALRKANLGDDIKLDLADVIIGTRLNEVGGVVARHQADGIAFRKLIVLALEGGEANTARTLDHEILHLLRNPRNWNGAAYGLFTEAEWKMLEAMAEEDPEGMARIKEDYGFEKPEVQLEEYIAYAYEEWAAGRREVSNSLARRALTKIKKFLNALRTTLTGEGFATPDQIFEAIGAGEIGARGAAQSDPDTRFAPRYRNPANPTFLRARQVVTDELASEVVGEPVRFSVTPLSSAQERQSAAVRGLGYYAGHPVETALRVLTTPVGGLDQHGRLIIGRKLQKQVEKTLVEREFSEASYLSFMNGIARTVRRGLVDRYGLDEAYVERDRQRPVDAANMARRGMEHLEKILKSDMQPAEYKTIQAILTGEAPTQEQYDALTEPLREAIDQLGHEAMQLGLISRESYERNKGMYLHRVYAGHEGAETAIAKAARDWGSSRRQKIVGDQLRGRGIFETVKTSKIFAHSQSFREGARGAPQKGDEVLVLARKSTDPRQAQFENQERNPGRILEKVYLDPNEAIPSRYAGWDSLGIHEVRGKKGGETVIWRDFSADERLAMGEILDARYTVAKTFQLMSNDLATGRFFKDIAANEEWARRMPPDGETSTEKLHSGLGGRTFADPLAEWVKVPDDKVGKSQAKKYGALAGMYVRAAIWRDISELEALQSPRWWKKAITQFKLNKTARSPGVHMNNMVSNLIFMDMADVRVRDLARGITEMARGGRYYEEARDNGAFGADFVSQEIQTDILEPLLVEIRKEMAGGQSELQSRFGAVGALANAFYQPLKAADKKALWLYQAEDQVFRMATYIRRREQGMTAKQAAIEARDQFLNYDIRAPWVNTARQTFLPFIAYSYRAIPRIFEVMTNRPWKLGKYWAYYWALNQAAYMLAPSDWDEEEERGALREDQKHNTWLGVPFTDNKVPRMIRLPKLGGTESDLPTFININRYVPAGDIFETNPNTMVPSWLSIGGPMVLAFELVTNKNLFFDEDIHKPLDPKADKLHKLASHAWAGWMPSLTPGIPGVADGAYHFRRIKEAVTKSPLRYGGQPYTVGEAVANAVGVKVQPLDVEAGYNIHGFIHDGYMRGFTKDKSALETQYVERNRFTESEYLEELAKIEAKEDAELKRYEELTAHRD